MRPGQASPQVTGVVTGIAVVHGGGTSRRGGPLEDSVEATREGVGREGVGEATGEDASGRDGRGGAGHGGEGGGHGGGRGAIHTNSNC
jgi:hypothetical protein